MDLWVTLVAPGYPPERLGGAEAHALRLKEALERMGVSVRALTPRDPLPEPRPGAVLHLHAASVALLPVVVRLSRGWVPVITLHDVSFACPQLFFARATGEACNARDARRCAVCMHRSPSSARIFYPLRRLGVAPLPGGAVKRLRDWLAWRKVLRTLHRRGARFVFPSAYVWRKFQELVEESPRGKVLLNPPGVFPRSPRSVVPDPGKYAREMVQLYREVAFRA